MQEERENHPEEHPEVTTRTVETTMSTGAASGTAPTGEPAAAHRQTVATRVVWYLAGILLVLLAFRFVLALLGANPANPFASFIYSASYPFVAPFFGLFGYHLAYGVSRLEIFTLVAMAVYAVVAWGLDKLVNITKN